MSILNAHASFDPNLMFDECTKDDEDGEEIFMAICFQGNSCGIAFSSPNGVLKCVPDFHVSQNFSDILTVILDVNPCLIIGTENCLRTINDITSQNGFKTFVLPRCSVDFDTCIQRVGLIKLPYAPSFVDEGENANYIMSLLPGDAPQMIRAAGALLDYLSKRLSPIEAFPNARFENILDIQLYLRKQYVYIDSATLIRLQVFDPSICVSGSRIVNSKHSQDTSELTLFDYLNTCSSTLGSRLLSKWLRFPLKDDEELHRRQYAVEFLTKSANRGLHKLLLSCIKRVGNIQRVLSKMHTSAAAPNEWKVLLQTLQSLKSIIDACRHHPELGAPFDSPDNASSPCLILCSLLEKIIETIDMSSTSSHKRFIVKQGHHAWLDEWKQIYRCLPDILSRLAEHELNRLRGHVDACGLIYFPLVGYLLQIPSSQASEELQELGLQYIFTNGELAYYRTATTKELDKRYGDVMYAILDAETSIMHELQEEILKAAKPLLRLLDFATELDCICALAAAAIRMNGVKPRMVSRGSIKIQRGRNILYETLHTNYQTNSFASPTEKGSVTLVTGPNASGKTMFIKQIGLIVYLAHIGSFVPADYATTPLMDTILALMPAEIERQPKTQGYLADASWLAMALRHASANSLLLLDEFPYFSDQVARKSLFLGFLEYMSQRSSPHIIVTGLNMNWAKTLLRPLAHSINLKKMRTTSDAKGPIFLHEVAPGITDTNYALEVASSAGIPTAVIATAAQNSYKTHRADTDEKKRGTKRRKLLKELIGMDLSEFTNKTRTFFAETLEI